MLLADASGLPLPPLGEHELLVFWCQLFVLLGTARAAGMVMRRLGQPRVVGELAAGILLGPSVLGRVWEPGMEWLFPADDRQAGLLLGAAWIGVLLLLAVTGTEMDLDVVRRRGRITLLTALGSLVVPMICGYALGQVVSDELIGSDGRRWLFALFLAIALSISSLPVAARILTDLGYLRREFAQVTLGAAMVNDAVGWLLLGVVVALAADDAVSILGLTGSVIGLVVFTAVAVTSGPRLLDASLLALRRREAGPAASVSIAVLTIIGSGAITQLIGLEAVIGAFIAGVVIGRSRLRRLAAIHHLETVTNGVFAPLFFAVAGLRVDLGLLADPATLWWALILLGVATASKLVGAVGGARLAGLGGHEPIAIGAGLNARGALEIIVATVGLTIGVLNQTSYTIIVAMALITSMTASPLLRRALRGATPGHDESEPGPGLGTTPGDTTSVLFVAVRATEIDQGEALARRLWGDGATRTLLASRVHRPPSARRQTRTLDLDLDLDLDRAEETAIAEAPLGHDALLVVDDGPGPAVLTAPYDQIIRRTTLPAIVLRPGIDPDERRQRILVPVGGNTASDSALAVAISLAGTSGASITLLHAVSPRAAAPAGIVVGPRHATDERWHRGVTMLETAKEAVLDRGIPVRTRLVADQSLSSAVLEASAGHGTIVLGTRRRPGTVPLGGYLLEDLARIRLTDLVLVVLPEPEDRTGSS